MDWSDSENEELPVAKQRKRSKFKGIRARLAGINVDAYKSLAQIEDQPFGGAESFFQERLNHWKEMDMSSHFRDVVRCLEPITGPLVQIVYHKDEILNVLLENCTSQEMKSLESLTDLFHGFARDLQDLFVPMLPRVVSKFSSLIIDFCHTPEPLEWVVRAQSTLFRSLSKLLIKRIPWVLDMTKPLRRHKVAHVRKLAAQSVAYLFRQAKPKALHNGLKCLLAETCTRDRNQFALDGVGLTLAEACIGIQGKLHSNASEILEVALDSMLLSPEQFKTGSQGKRMRGEVATSENAAPTWLTIDTMRSRCSEGVQVSLRKLLLHVKKGSEQSILVDCIAKEIGARAERYKQAQVLPEKEDLDHQDSLGCAARDLGRAVAHIAYAFETISGRNNLKTEKLLSIPSELSKLTMPRESVKDPSNQAEIPQHSKNSDVKPGYLVSQILRLFLAIVTDLQEKEPLEQLEDSSRGWSKIFLAAEPEDILDFTRALAVGAEAAIPIFATDLLVPLSAILDQRKSQPDDPLLVDTLLIICEFAHKYRSKTGMGIPRLLTGHCSLDSHALSLLAKWVSSNPACFTKLDVAVGWLSLRCLPELSAKPDELIKVCKQVLKRTGELISSMKSCDVINQDPPLEDIILLEARAKGVLGKALYSQSPSEFASFSEEVLKWFEGNSGSYCALEVAADTLVLLKQILRDGKLEEVLLLTENSLVKILPIINPLLGSSSQNVRKAALRLVSSFDLPPLTGAKDSSDSSSNTNDRCDIFEKILEIESQPLSLKNDQRAVALTNTLQNWLEANRIPEPLLLPILNSTLGMMFIRFSRLWKPVADTLGIASSQHPEVVWSLVFPMVLKSQGALLDGAKESSKPGPDNNLTLLGRMKTDILSGGVEASGGHTDHLTCFCHFLDACSKRQGLFLQEKSTEWVDSFLEYVLRRPSNSPWRLEAGKLQKQKSGQCTLPDWRKGLGGWLSAIETIHDLRKCHHSTQLLQAIAPLLSENSTSIQQHVLRCLKSYKVKHMAAYFDRLMLLTDSATMKEELVRFPLSNVSEAAIPVKHRKGLIPILTAILHPKLRMPKGKKYKGQDLWIVHFFGSMQVDELKYFLGNVLLDFGGAFITHSDESNEIPDVDAVATLEGKKLLLSPAWVEGLDNQLEDAWINKIDRPQVKRVPLKAKQATLDNMSALLGVLGFKLERYLGPVFSLLIHILEDVSEEMGSRLESDEAEDIIEGNATNNLKDEAEEVNDGVQVDDCSTSSSAVQRQCLEMINSIWIKYPEACNNRAFVDRVLTVVQPWMCDLAKVDAHISRRRLLLQIACALSSDDHLSQHLAPASHQEGSQPDKPVGSMGLGFCLLSEVVAAVSCLESTEGFHDSILTVIDNLLCHGKTVQDEVLLPHVPQLIDALKQYILAVFAGDVPADFSGTVMKLKKEADRELAVLEKVSHLGMDNKSARSLTQAMLPLITCSVSRKKASKQNNITLRTLRCLTAVWATLAKGSHAFSREETRSICSQLALQASQLKGQEAREALSNTFTAIAEMDQSLKQMEQMFAALNSFTEDLSNNLDYDRRLEAYHNLSTEAWKGFPKPVALPLIHTCLYDIANPDDISLRQAASEALSRLILALTDTSTSAMPPAITTGLYDSLCKNIGAQDLAVRQEHLARVRQIIITYPETARGLFSLANTDDEEHDFFHNVSHLQLHRRVRAWIQLTKSIESNQDLVTKETMVVLVPLILQAIFDGRASENSHSRRIASQEETSRESSVVAATIHVLSSLASRLTWELYSSLLRRLMGAVNRAITPSKGMVRALCAVVDAIPFDIVDNTQKDALEELLDDEDLKSGTVDSMHEEENRADENAGGKSSKARRMKSHGDEDLIADCMLHRTFPMLKKLLIDGEDKARSPIASSLVRLLRKAPKKFEQYELRGALQRVANLMKHRWQGVRDDARQVFLGMSKELGSKYIMLLVTVLKAALPAKGFGVHVLGYTIHAVLEALADTSNMGDTDSILDLVLPIVDAEIFGEVADAKEVKQFTANYREAKKCRAYDTCYLLMKTVSFDPCADSFVEFIRERLELCTNPKLRNRLSDLLVYLAKGVLDNRSAKLPDLMLFIHEIISAGMTMEEEAISKAEASAGMAGMSKLAMQPKEMTTVSARYEPLLVEFALKLLHNGLKKGQFDVRNVEVLGLLDPFLPLLVRCLKSRHSPVSVLALKCVCLVVRLPLPGLTQAANAAGNTVLTMLDRVGSSSDAVAQDCFGFLARILQEGDAFQPTNDQVNSLLVLVRGDLEETVEHHAGFALLGAMLSRKIMVPGIYDMMNKVQQIMVRSHTTSIRQTCANLLLRFLLNYPLGEVRLIDHLKFVLTNLSYEFETGRLQALQLLGMLMNKFPAELLEVQAEFFYLPLVVRLANDESKACREQIAEVLKTLMKRIGHSPGGKLIGITMRWLCSQDGKLKQTAAQAMGLFAEVRRTQVAHLESEILEALHEILTRQISLLENKQIESEISDNEINWQETYSAVVLLEKLAEHLGMKSTFVKYASEGGSTDTVEAKIWSCTMSLLRYNHAWVRKSSVRLVMHGLAAMGSDHIDGELLKVFGGRSVMNLSFLLFSTIGTRSMDPDLVMHATKCLVWIAPSLHSATIIGSDPAVTSKGLNDPESRDLDKANISRDDSAEHSLDAEASTVCVGGNMTLLDTNGGKGGLESNRVNQAQDSDQEVLHMFGLVRKMASIADDRSATHQPSRLLALKFFAALTSRLGATSIVQYLPIIMVPLYRILEAPKDVIQHSVVHGVAEEVQMHIKRIVGGDVLLNAYNKARHSVQTRRQERKRKQKLQKIHDPEAAAQRRIQKNKSKLAWRKRDREYRRIAKPLTKRRKV